MMTAAHRTGKSRLRNVFTDGNLGGARQFLINLFGEEATGVIDGAITILQTVWNILSGFIEFVNTYVRPIVEQIFSFIVGTVLPQIAQAFAEWAPTIASILQGLAEVVSTIATAIMAVIQFLMPTIDVFPYYESVENITESAGGADRESDAAFYERMRESVETYSTAGPLGGYEYFAKSASALIADVKATSPKPGEVDVRVLLTGGELPGEEILKEVLDILNADTVRPLTDHVTVAAPQAVPYNIDVTYYTQEGGALSADTIAADVAAAVKSFQKWQAEKMGRDVNPSRLIALLMQTGVKRVEVRSPVFATVADNAVAQVGTVSVVNGGAERE